MKSITTTIIAALLSLPVAAQERGLAACIEQAIESNFTIKIKRNTAEIAANDARVNPMLPTLEASARQNQAINNTLNRAADNAESRLSGARTNTATATVSLNWRLFDGLDMFIARDRLEELENIGELSLQQGLEALVVDVCSLYYNVVVQQYRLAATRYSLELSRERYEDAQFRYGIGKISGLEAKQAIVDLHADSSAYTRQQEQLKNAYINLNKVMNVNLQLDEYVNDTIVMGHPLDPADMERNTLASNKLLMIARGEQRVSALDYKRARAALFPTLDFTSGYNYTRTATSTLSRANGPYWGFSVNLPLFNRLQGRTRARNARLEADNKEWTYQEIEKELLGDLALLYNAYESNLLMVNFEQEGAAIAGNNLDEAMAMFKLGALSGIDFRQFQQSYINAIDRKFSAMYQAKMSELSLLLVSGRASDLLDN
ncbi:MAG: TolC family protein [Odoribacteraceae bacterium]|jgi:outer membrane protein TolC|nr:TolC family protein [Odoribacteraceae bacterium]